MEWNAEMQRRADAAGIRLFNWWPAAAVNWKEGSGEGDLFAGFRDDPAEAVWSFRPKTSTRLQRR